MVIISTSVWSEEGEGEGLEESTSVAADHLKAPKSKCWDAGGVSMQSAALSACLSVSHRQSHALSH